MLIQFTANKWFFSCKCQRLFLYFVSQFEKNRRQQINWGNTRNLNRNSEFYKNHRLNIFISVWWIFVIYESWFTNRRIKKRRLFYISKFVTFWLSSVWLCRIYYVRDARDLYTKNQQQKNDCILHAQWNKVDFTWKSNRYKIVIMNI